MKAELYSALRIISTQNTAVRLNIGRSTLYDWLDPRSKNYKSDLPKPVRHGSSVGFIEREIDDYILGLMAARSDRAEN